jgi:hypothetical protein
MSNFEEAVRIPAPGRESGPEMTRGNVTKAVEVSGAAKHPPRRAS